MNIFDALSQGKGRLNEENLSAMLAFLLSPGQPHGLGDIFLRYFLKIVAETCGEKSRFDKILNDSRSIRSDVLLESPYTLGNKRRVVDIDIRILEPISRQMDNREGLAEIHRIAIENKVKAQSANPKQFEEEFSAILKDIAGDDQIKVTMVFLTPSIEHKKLTQEYESLDKKTLGSHRKTWLHWSGKKENYHTIVDLIREILRKESEAEIPPMMEYLRHTLKAFVLHLLGSASEPSAIPADGYGIAEVVFFKVSGGTYRIERYENSTIRVVNMETQKYEAAKPVLRKAIREKRLGIDLNHSTGAEKNTRNLGREVMSQLVLQNKSIQPS